MYSENVESNQSPSFTLNVLEDVEAVNERCAPRRREQAGQHGHGRRFAGSVVSEQDRDLVIVHVQMDAVDGHSVFDVFLAQAANLNAGAQTDRFFFDGVGVAQRPLGAAGRGVLRHSRRPTPIFLLNNPIGRRISESGIHRGSRMTNKVAQCTEPAITPTNGQYQSNSNKNK